MPTHLEFHILQSFAPSNLNRDDTGSPKDAVFGGVRRGRISSQCLKRAARLYMQDGGLVPATAKAYRTKRVTDLLTKRLRERGVAEEHAPKAATSALESLGSQKNIKVKDGKTEYLMFVGERELEEMAAAVAPHAAVLAEPKAKVSSELQAALADVLKKRAAGAVDIALFGRMLANMPEANTDASCQVAHAISTHRVDREFDYYTAVDDLQPSDNAGADMIGTVEFNSSCYYRYSVIDVDQLVQNVGDASLAHSAVTAFARAVIEAEPTGKQNSFAAHNPPSTVLVTLRSSGGPKNLANAFESPVDANGAGYARSSAERLKEYWTKVDDAYGAADTAWVLDLSGAFDSAANVSHQESVRALVTAISDALR